MPRRGLLVQLRELSWGRRMDEHKGGQRWRVQGQRVQEQGQMQRQDGRRYVSERTGRQTDWRARSGYELPCQDKSHTSQETFWNLIDGDMANIEISKWRFL